MRKVILSFCCLSFSLCSNAQSLIIWNTSSIIQKIDLSSKPVVNIYSDKMLISGPGLEIEYGIDDVHRFTYETTPTDIKSISSQAGYVVKDGRIMFEGITSAEDIALYTIGGIRIPIKTERLDNSIILPLSSISPGVYLLNSCGRTAKIVRK